MGRYLQDLGFSEGEEKVYLALLRLGSTTTGPIAQDAQVSRSKLYEILEKLVRKGIVSHYKKNNVSYFRAAQPERIVEFLKEREDTISKQRHDFEARLPLFKQFLEQQPLPKEAEVYEGMEGIKNVREEALEKMGQGQYMYFFGNATSGHEYLLGYWDDWNRRRIQKKIWTCTIYNQDATEFGERRKILPYTQVKYLPQAGPTHAWIEIYGDVVAIAMKYQTPMSIVIRNPFVAQSFLTYFQILWDVSVETVS